MDRLTREHRSWNMSRIRGRDTQPELVVRSVLHRLGFRFRVHEQELPGCPDVVLPRHRVVVFVHGCFWHRHRGCRFAYTPKSNGAFWSDKFEQNVGRDSRNRKELRRLGWRVVVIWECQAADRTALTQRLAAAFKAVDGPPTGVATE
ncbi:MAG: DNA mismatch endonuclease Vsr [Gammaproteobacteria bacterium]|nr:DNA mismatch endonuclease Vsr [Gammaproteobacteria bacterium]